VKGLKDNQTQGTRGVVDNQWDLRIDYNSNERPQFCVPLKNGLIDLPGIRHRKLPTQSSNKPIGGATIDNVRSSNGELVLSNFTNSLAGTAQANRSSTGQSIWRLNNGVLEMYYSTSDKGAGKIYRFDIPADRSEMLAVLEESALPVPALTSYRTSVQGIKLEGLNLVSDLKYYEDKDYSQGSSIVAPKRIGDVAKELIRVMKENHIGEW